MRKQITHQYPLDLNTSQVTVITVPRRRTRVFEAPGKELDSDPGCFGICLGVCETRADCPFGGCTALASGFQNSGTVH